MLLRIKIFVSALVGEFTKFIMWIPSHHIRLAYAKLILGRLGKNCTICRRVEFRVPRNIFIGDNSIINARTMLDARGGVIKVGKNVDVAQDVFIWTQQHDYNDDYHQTEGAPVEIKDYAWIAARANVLPGVTIGRGAVVGTCSLITKNVPDMDVVGGVPAKHISTRTSGLKYTIKHRIPFQ